MSTRRTTDPVSALLDIIDQRVKNGRPAEPVMGTITSLSPLTVTLDTGQVIESPIVIGGIVA